MSDHKKHCGVFRDLEMDRSLSAEEVLKISDGGLVIRFSDLSGFDSIEDLFGRHDKCIILLESEPNRGHWVCLYRDRTDRTVSYMDPYGFSIEEPLKMMDSSILWASGQEFPYLLKMLLDYKGSVYYMDRKLQKMQLGINTCGRWCGFYLRIADLVSIDDFARAFKSASAESGLSTDEMIVSITDEIL